MSTNRRTHAGAVRRAQPEHEFGILPLCKRGSEGDFFDRSDTRSSCGSKRELLQRENPPWPPFFKGGEPSNAAQTPPESSAAKACSAPVISLVLAVALAVCACADRPPKQAPLTEVVVARRIAVPADPGDAAWANAPTFVAPLLPQDMVEPRLMTPTTKEMRVQAISDGKEVAFHLEWEDANADDLPRPGRFPDACAVQIPARIERDVPAPQMGEEGRTVEITYWRASWQAVAEGRKDAIQAIYPGATVDHYPFQAPSLQQGSPEQQKLEQVYAPARSLGNLMASPAGQPVQALVAEGPGTLRPATDVRVRGRGTRTLNGWSVVLVRPLPEGLAPEKRSAVAFAVWQGGKDEVGARKMRSVWVPLSMEKG
jgi:hypothetical protein